MICVALNSVPTGHRRNPNCSQKHEIYSNINTASLSSHQAHRQRCISNESAKLENEMFCVISGSRCISTDVGISTDTLQMSQWCWCWCCCCWTNASSYRYLIHFCIKMLVSLILSKTQPHPSPRPVTTGPLWSSTKYAKCPLFMSIPRKRYTWQEFPSSWFQSLTTRC